ncbi:MAG: rRNA maturation RNase YbeY [Bacteroidia bacterium]|jgi:rRNA maturation RNase YbeY
MASPKLKKERSLSLTKLIQFNFIDSKTSTLQHKTVLREWIHACILKEGFETGFISYNFTSDKYLLGLNKQYLNHDYFTDIITFDLTEGKMISGDIYISLDRVKDNSHLLNEMFHVELYRVIIHGVLHLCGYGDKSVKDAKTMRKKENYYLALLPL